MSFLEKITYVTLPATSESLRDIPTVPGVYRFHHAGGEIAYVGKAVSLKARLSSHFQLAKTDNKENRIVNDAEQISYVICDSELNALLLESYLISSLKPKYNVRWKDDKSYLYIKITIKDKYPKVFLARRENDGKSLYFGPFPSTYVASELIRTIRRIYHFCTQVNTRAGAPCFYGKIGLCGPCPNELERLHRAHDPSYTQLKRQYTSNITNVIKILEGNSNKILESYFSLLKKYTREQKFEEAIPIRACIRRLEALKHIRSRDEWESLDNFNASAVRMTALRQILQRFFPDVAELHRIECYDMSTLSFTDSTASLVVATDGLPDKSQYKRFKIKDETAESDFEMIEEVMERRFKNSRWEEPQLLVIDGGKPQVRMVMSVAARNNITIPVIGIAKNPDRIVVGIQDLPTVRPERNHEGLRLLQTLRDEAHRFAKKYQVFLRSKRMKDKMVQ